jgi:hypothetical protein
VLMSPSAPDCVGANAAMRHTTCVSTTMILKPSVVRYRAMPKPVITLLLTMALAFVAMMFPQTILTDPSDSVPPRLEPDRPDPPLTRVDLDARNSFERGTWQQPGVRYLVYQTSGGLSNQRILIEQAIILGRALNRTVLIPQLAPHSSMWWNFNKIQENDLVPFDAMMDRERAETICPVLPLRGMTFKKFLFANENKFAKTWKRVERNSLSEKRARPWTMNDVMNMFGEEDADVLFFAQGTMWECFLFDNRLVEEAQQAVRPNLSLRRAARLAVANNNKKASGIRTNRFYCVHIRFMDDDGTLLREGLLKPATTFVWRMRKWNETYPLYVATVPGKRTSAFFKPFKSKFAVTVFGDVLERDVGVKTVLGSVPRKMRETTLGLIEQLVCARAVGFLGTGFSTFSEMIRRMRRWRVLAIDDGVDLSLAEQAAEEAWSRVVTKCDKPTWSC